MGGGGLRVILRFPFSSPSCWSLAILPCNGIGSPKWEEGGVTPTCSLLFLKPVFLQTSEKDPLIPPCFGGVAVWVGFGLAMPLPQPLPITCSLDFWACQKPCLVSSFLPLLPMIGPTRSCLLAFTSWPRRPVGGEFSPLGWVRFLQTCLTPLTTHFPSSPSSPLAACFWGSGATTLWRKHNCWPRDSQGQSKQVTRFADYSYKNILCNLM